MLLRTLIAALFVVVAASDVRGQELQRIAAIVNDEVISMHDLTTRMDMVIMTSDIENSAQTRQRLAPQILRSLIDERLQLQEAKRRNVAVSESDMQGAISNIEKTNNIAPGEFDKFLGTNRIPRQTVMDQIRAGIAWQKLVGRRLRPNVTIGDEEVDEIIGRLKLRIGQPEYRVAEIFLAVDSAKDEEEVRRTAARMVEQLRAGARFDVMARQFSQSATAAVGGDAGWLHEGEISDEVMVVIKSLAPGRVSDAVRVPSGYQIFRLAEVRAIGVAAEAVKLNIRQVQLAAPNPGDEAGLLARRDQYFAARRSWRSCADIDTFARTAQPARVTDSGMMSLAELGPTIRGAVSGLKAGQTSEPMLFPEGIMFFMVCEREEPKAVEPSRAEILRGLTNLRLDLMSRRYMRDIRLAATVDVRV